MSTKTPEELIAFMVDITGAERRNAVIAEPGTAGHDKPYDPWSANVMLMAGIGQDGVTPWLYLACRCGWWLGYGPQHDPADLAHIAKVHGGNCKLNPAAAA